MNSERVERLSIRITKEQQHSLRLAAAFKNMSVSDYVLGAIYEKIADDREKGALEIPKFVR